MTDPRRKLALVTGASAGIGEGFARRLAMDSYDLILVARRRERLDALSQEMLQDYSTSCEILAADLATDEGVTSVEERLGPGDVDLLINNAGFGTFGAFAKLPIERELEELDVNVRALLRLSHAALVPMTKRRAGGIINVASAAGFQPIPFNATYSATKAFVLHFTEALHEEAREHGVRVTCLCPGPVRTEFQQVAGISENALPSFTWVSIETVVNDAISALHAGRAISLPGTFNLLAANSVRLAPRFLVRRISGSMFRTQGGGL